MDLPERPQHPEREVRVLGEAPELRAAGDDDDGGDGPGAFTGYAAVFEQLSLPLGYLMPFREKIARGAFADSIKADDVRMLAGHDNMPGSVLARSQAGQGTLLLREDDHGLYVEAELPDTQAGRDLAVSVQRRDVTQMSFGFIVKREEWQSASDDEPEIRSILEAELFDVSPVTFPAYPQTTAEVRHRVQRRQREHQGAPLVPFRRRLLDRQHQLPGS